MADDSPIDRLLREAGARFEGLTGDVDSARAQYRIARNARSLPTDSEGRSRIVCRRHVEQRAVELDDHYRPSCYEVEHPDCEGCVEDLHEGCIETWSPG